MFAYEYLQLNCNMFAKYTIQTKLLICDIKALAQHLQAIGDDRVLQITCDYIKNATYNMNSIIAIPNSW